MLREPSPVVWLLLACAASLAPADVLASGADSTSIVPAPQPPLWRPALAGALGGAAGFAFGALIGVADWDSEGDDIAGAVYGAIAGETVGLALGTWLGNERRGYLPLDLLVSAVLFIGGIWAVDQINPGPLEVGLFLVGQLGATVAVERIGAARRTSP